MKIYINFLSWAFGPMLWHVIIGLLMIIVFTWAMLSTPLDDMYVAPWVFYGFMGALGWGVPAVIAYKVVQSWNDYKAGKSR